MAKSKPAVDPLDDLEETAAPAKPAKAAAKPAKAAPKKATQQELDEVFGDEDKAEAAAPKAKKAGKVGVAKTDLAGKVLVQTAECARIKGDSIRAEAIAPFKGNGMKYETAIAKLAVNMVPRRGARAEAGASEAFAIDMVRTMVRLGFLATK